MKPSNRVQFNIIMPDYLLYHLKKEALEQRRPAKDLAIQAIEEYLGRVKDERRGR